MSEEKDNIRPAEGYEENEPVSSPNNIVTELQAHSKLRSNSDPQFHLLRENDSDNAAPRGSWADSTSDISDCSSTNRPVSLCVKYAESEDNLLAIESDLEALDAESTYDKLQRQFDNSKLSDIFDYEQGLSFRTTEEIHVSNTDQEESPRVCEGERVPSPVTSHVTY
ncbi:hypothetical protein ACHWQZ_G016234 [Mnemiopsis leidyi]